MNTISKEEFAALSNNNFLSDIFDDIVNAGKDLVTGEIGNVITGESSPNDILDNLVEAGQNKIIKTGNDEFGKIIGGSIPPRGNYQYLPSPTRPRPPQDNYPPPPPPRPPQGNYLPPPPNMPAVTNRSPVEPVGRTLALPPKDNPVEIINNPLPGNKQPGTEYSPNDSYCSAEDLDNYDRENTECRNIC